MGLYRKPETGDKMAIPGRQPNENSINRNKPRVETREFIDLPFDGPWPVELPETRTIITKDGQLSVPLQAATYRWFDEVKRLPHAVVWDAAMWGFVVDTAVNVVDSANCGVASAMVEQRQREASEILKTHEARFKARVVYKKPVEEPGDGAVSEFTVRRRRQLGDA